MEQLDGAKSGTLAHKSKAAATDKSIQFAALDARYGILHARTLQAVGVMRSRALADPTLRPVVNELSARGDSNRAIEEEGEELLAAWSQEFGEDFVPAPGNTFEAFQALYEGSTTVPAFTRKAAPRHAAQQVISTPSSAGWKTSACNGMRRPPPYSPLARRMAISSAARSPPATARQPLRL